MKLTKKQMGMIYLTPWIIGILVFKLVPFVSTLVLSFADYDLITAPRFIGFQNYIKIFTQDKKFLASLIVTFKYVFLTVPIKLAFALFQNSLLYSFYTGRKCGYCGFMEIFICRYGVNECFDNKNRTWDYKLAR